MPEPIAVNMMIVFAQVFGIIGNFATTAPRNFFSIFYKSVEVGNNGLWAYSLILFPSWFYLTFFYKGDYKKQMAEKAAAQAAKQIKEEYSHVDVLANSNTLSQGLLSEENMKWSKSGDGVEAISSTQ